MHVGDGLERVDGDLQAKSVVPDGAVADVMGEPGRMETEGAEL